MQNETRAILRHTGVSVHPDEFAVVSVEKENWAKVLQTPNAGPSASSPFMVLSDPYEITLILTHRDLDAARAALEGSRVEYGFRMLTFTVELDFNVVGFMAEISRILAEANISIFALSSFSRDHLLVRQEDLANALKALGPHVEELC